MNPCRGGSRVEVPVRAAVLPAPRVPRLWCRVLSRRVRDPNRIAFLAARGGAVGPSDEAGRVPAWAAGETAVSRRCCMGTSNLPGTGPSGHPHPQV